MARKKIPYGTKLPVVLTIKERNTVRDKTLGDPTFGNFGVVKGKNIRLMLSLDDIEDAQGYIAAEANNTKDKKFEKELDRIFDKLQVFLDQYADQQDL